MRVGKYQLSGIRKRFWFFLGFVALVIFLVISMWPRSESPLAAWTGGEETAFPTRDLENPSVSLESVFKERGLCQEGSMNCIYYIQDGDDFWSALNPNQVGAPLRFRAYIPSQDAASDSAAAVPLAIERKSLFSSNFSNGGWQFRPAMLLSSLSLNEAQGAGGGFDPLTLDTQAANNLSLDDDGFLVPGGLMLGFQGGVPSSGAIYDFDAMLFSTSNAIQVPGDARYAAEPLPTLLVRDFRRVSNEEVLEPASEAAELDLTYSAGTRYELALHRFEWPADGKARMCVTLSNISPGATPVWEGLFEGIQLRVGGVTLLGSPAPGSRFLAGTETDVMQIGESISGYIVFGLEQEGSEANVGNVSGSPSEQDVRLSVASLLQVSPGAASGGLGAQQVFVGLSDGMGGGADFDPILADTEGYTTPLSRSETCSE